MELLHSILAAFVGLRLEAQIAVLLFIILAIFIVESVSHHYRMRARRVRHRQLRTARARANSNQEDFFDMITRFYEEIDDESHPLVYRANRKVYS